MDKITAKQWLLKNYRNYGITSIKTESEFLALLNILQSHGLTLEDMHNCIFNGHREFMTFWNYDGWATMDDLYEAILSYNSFYTESEFIDWMCEMQTELKDEGYDPEAEIKSWTYAEDWMYDNRPVDTMIVKTEDGYVQQVSY